MVNQGCNIVQSDEGNTSELVSPEVISRTTTAPLPDIPSITQKEENKATVFSNADEP